MIILDKKHKKTVTNFIKLVKANQDKEVKLYTALCKKLKVKEGTSEDDSLFDHIYNDSEWTIKYE
jgi:hypothetical protein